MCARMYVRVCACVRALARSLSYPPWAGLLDKPSAHTAKTSMAETQVLPPCCSKRRINSLSVARRRTDISSQRVGNSTERGRRGERCPCDPLSPLPPPFAKCHSKYREALQSPAPGSQWSSRVFGEGPGTVSLAADGLRAPGWRRVGSCRPDAEPETYVVLFSTERPVGSSGQLAAAAHVLPGPAVTCCVLSGLCSPGSRVPVALGAGLQRHGFSVFQWGSRW